MSRRARTAETVAARRRVDNAAVCAVISDVLRDETAGARDPAGVVAARIGCSKRAAKNWLLGVNAPNLIEALNLIHGYPVLHARLLELLGMAGVAAHPEIARRIEGLIATWRSLRGEDAP